MLIASPTGLWCTVCGRAEVLPAQIDHDNQCGGLCREIQHSNDRTPFASVKRANGVVEGPGLRNHIPAVEGDVITLHTLVGEIVLPPVTAADIRRGYMVAEATWAYGDNDWAGGAVANPVFIRPRASVRHGDGRRLSSSTLA